MKTIILIITFAILISLQFSCDRCPNEPTHHIYYLSDEDKAFLPYTGTDTLKFSNNADSTQIITFVGTIKNYLEEIEIGNDCITTRDTLEVLSIDFMGDDDYELKVKIYFQYDNGSVWPKLINTINEVEYVISEPNTLPVLDSIKFNNNNYYSVYYMAKTSCNNGYDYKVYFNKIYGILFFELINCTAWSRVI